MPKKSDVTERDEISEPTPTIEVSRRDAIKTAAVATVAGTAAVAASSGIPTMASAQDTAENDTVDTSQRWNAQQGSLYTEQTGYLDADIRGYPGRRVFGSTIGVLQLDAKIPMLPGNVSNLSTFDFGLMYETTGPVDFSWIAQAEPHPEMIKRSVAAAKRLELQGVRAVVGNCGFWANYQPYVGEALVVPFFSSSLMQIPLIMTAIHKDQKIGVLTANGEALKIAPALEYAGVSSEAKERVVIYGMENNSEMQNVLANEDFYNPKRLEEGLVETCVQMVKDHPDIGAILLECTEFSAHAYAIQDAVRTNVWDFTTLINWVHAGTVRRPFRGFV